MAKVAYDPDLRPLTATLPDAIVLTIEGKEPFEFVATPGGEEEQVAVFLAEAERTALDEMIDDVLKTIPIAEGSRASLEAVRAELVGVAPVVARVPPDAGCRIVQVDGTVGA